jgi:hypothetical protein
MNKKLIVYAVIGIAVLSVVTYFLFFRKKEGEKRSINDTPTPTGSREQQLINRIRNRVDFKALIERACQQNPEKCAELRSRNQQ